MYTMKYVKEHKQAIILVALAVFIVAEIIIFGVLDFGRRDGSERSPGTLGAPGDSEEVLSGADVSEFTTDVPKDAVETGTQGGFNIAPSNESERKLGIYNITISKNGFSPDQLVVVQGNLLRLQLTAEGGTYDFYIPAFGTYVRIPEGETVQKSINAVVSGTFRIECRDACPVSGKIYGQLIVKPRE